MLTARRNLVNAVQRRAVVCFSSSSTPLDDKKKYVKQRAVYKDQVSQLRKEWMKDHEKKTKADLEAKKQKKDQEVLETAIRLRVKRAKKSSSIATDRRFKEIALAEYRAKLAKHIVLKDLEHQRAEKRFRQLVADLHDESSTWITMENMDERITPALFDAPAATTGLITKYSDNMRHYLHPDDYRRIIAEEKARGGIDEFGNVMPDERWKFALHNSNVDESWEARQAEIAQHRTEERLILERNLNTLVGTSEEREQYAELVRQYIEQTNVDEQAMATGRQERQERLLEEESSREEVLDDMIAEASMSGKNTDRLQQLSQAMNLDQNRDALVSRFKQNYPELPGALGPVYSAMRNHIGRLGCQEDFDAFLTSYVSFVEKLKETPEAELVEMVSDAELITNADYLDRIGERLHDMQDEIENSSDSTVPANFQRLYAAKLKSYREDWWKFQALLVLSGRADECSLCEDFPDRLVHPSEDPTEL